jgi:hypothetical protein
MKIKIIESKLILLQFKHTALPDAAETKTEYRSRVQTLGNWWLGREE